MWIQTSSFREPVHLWFYVSVFFLSLKRFEIEGEGEVDIQQRKRLKQSNLITTNAAKKERDEGIKKDVPTSNVSLPKKPTKSPLNNTVSKRWQLSDQLESECEVVSWQLENDVMPTRPHKESASSGINKRKTKMPCTIIKKESNNKRRW